jgi:putative ABC transport system permease protein
VNPLHDFTTDIRYACRMIRRSPLVGSTVLLTMIVGICASAAVASVLLNVLIRPLPFPDSGRIVRFERTTGGVPSGFGVVGLPDMREWRERTRSMVAVAGWSGGAATLTGDGRDPTRIRIAAVTERFERVLGIAPQLGRWFRDAEHVIGADRVVILTHRFWQREYGGDPSILGRAVELDGNRLEIVGVLPALEFAYPTRAELWIPMAFSREAWQLTIRGASWMTAIGRLKPEWSVTDGERELSSIQRALVQEFPRGNEGQDGVSLTPLKETVVGDTRSVLALLAVTVAGILLIACANVGVLLASQANRRRYELTMRAVLGGRRGRLVRQLLTESLVLSVIGGGVGVLLVPSLVQMLLNLYPGGLPRAAEVRVDGLIMLVVGVMIVGSGLLAGLIPVWYASRDNLADELGQRGGSDGRAASSARSGLVVGQTALSANLSSEDPGFRTGGVLTFRLQLPSSRYPDETLVRRFFGGILDEFRAHPMVTDAGAVNFLPLTGGEWGGGFTPIGAGRTAPQDAMVRIAWPGYHQTLGISVTRGRLFERRDDFNAARVAIINETAAREAFGGEDPLGRQVEFEGAVWQVVGILSDVQHRRLGADAVPEIHIPATMFPRRALTIALSLSGNAAAFVPTVREVIRRHDANLAVTSIATMAERARASVAGQQFRAVLMSALGLAALVLVLVGTYGVTASGVERRSREIGIRMALGERESRVLARVLAGAARIAGVGAVLGVVIALIAAPAVAQFLFHVGPRDPATLTAVPVALLLVATLSGLAPALRASHMDPAVVMREE